MPFRLSTAGFLLVVGALFGAFIAQSNQFVKSMMTDANGPTQALKALGSVAELSGLVSRKPFGQLQSSLINKNALLHHLDTLEIGARSVVRIHFDSGYELEVTGPGLLVLTLWDPGLTASPVLVQLSTGDARLLKEGERGQLYVIHGGKWINPKAISEVELRTLPLGLKVQPPIATETQTDSPSSPSAKSPSDPVRLGSTPNNDEIDIAVARWANDFQKCQSNAIREQREARGKMMVALTITPSGDVKNPRVVSSDIKDPALQSCVVQVFERIKLRPFQGGPIERTYPLSFE